MQQVLHDIEIPGYQMCKLLILLMISNFYAFDLFQRLAIHDVYTHR